MANYIKYYKRYNGSGWDVIAFKTPLQAVDFEIIEMETNAGFDLSPSFGYLSSNNITISNDTPSIPDGTNYILRFEKGKIYADMSTGVMYYCKTTMPITSFDANEYNSSTGFLTTAGIESFFTIVGTYPGPMLNKIAGKATLTDILTSNDLNTAKLQEKYIPDSILGQLVYGGTVNGSTGVATLTTAAKNKLQTITGNSLTSSLQLSTGTGTGAGIYSQNQGIYYIVSTAGDFANLDLNVGDWLIATGDGWGKVDNTDAVTMVNGQIGPVNTYKGSFESSTTYANFYAKYKGDVWSYGNYLYLNLDNIAEYSNGLGSNLSTLISNGKIKSINGESVYMQGTAPSNPINGTIWLSDSNS